MILGGDKQDKKFKSKWNIFLCLVDRPPTNLNAEKVSYVVVDFILTSVFSFLCLFLPVSFLHERAALSAAWMASWGDLLFYV